MVDATHRPLKISTEYAVYADKHEIFDFLTKLLLQLILDKPTDPLNYILNVLEGKRNVDAFKIIILGPPGSGKRTLAEALSSLLGVVLIDPIATIKSYLIAKLKRAPKHARILASGTIRVPPRTVALAIAKRLKKHDCAKKGWVLPGFPKNNFQAMEFSDLGFTPEHVVILEIADDTAITRAQESTMEIVNSDQSSSSNGSKSTLLHTILRSLRIYRQCCWNVFDFYSSRNIRKINAEKTFFEVLNEVYQFLSHRPQTYTPFNPRILLLGPPGSGKSVQGTAIASKYNLVHVSFTELISRWQNEHESRSASSISPIKIPEVSDEEAVKIVSKRLLQSDCVTKGWVLRDFPENTMQAFLFYRAGFFPNRVIFLELPDHLCLLRIQDRRVDPKTGNWYHPTFNPAPSSEIANRLVAHPRDRLDRYQQQLQRYRRHEDTLSDFFRNSQKLDASRDSYGLFEQIENILLHPNPRQMEPLEVLIPKPTKKESSFFLINYHIYVLDIDFVDFD